MAMKDNAALVGLAMTAIGLLAAGIVRVESKAPAAELAIVRDSTVQNATRMTDVKEQLDRIENKLDNDLAAHRR